MSKGPANLESLLRRLLRCDVALRISSNEALAECSTFYAPRRRWARTSVELGQELEERGYGYVPMQRGEFGDCEGALKQHGVCPESPADMEENQLDDFFWVGLFWLSVAKYIHVIIKLWEESAWALPSKLRRGCRRTLCGRMRAAVGVSRAARKS